ERDAEKSGADEVIGVKTYVYDLGRGLVEFMAIGTAVKKMARATTQSDTLPAQAIIRDRDTFIDSTNEVSAGPNKNASAANAQRGPLTIILGALILFFYIFRIFFLRH